MPLSANITPFYVAEKIQIPVEEWPGNCYAVSHAMLEHDIVKGKLRYGHYHGPINSGSRFGARAFTQHGWIEKKNEVIDPTRWVFECALPYIYVGPKDPEVYDFGGNHLRKLMNRPLPEYNPSEKNWPLQTLKPLKLRQLIYSLLGSDEQESLGIAQVLWLANLPLDVLGDNAKMLYEWIGHKLKLMGFIPLDNKLEILG